MEKRKGTNENQHQRNPKGQSGMDNLETMATFGTQDTRNLIYQLQEIL